MFPVRLEELRRKNNLTQTDLGKSIGLNRTTIGSYETGERIPNLETLNALADYFGVTIDYLAGRVDQPTATEDELNRLIEAVAYDPSTDNLEKLLEIKKFPKYKDIAHKIEQVNEQYRGIIKLLLSLEDDAKNS